MAAQRTGVKYYQQQEYWVWYTSDIRQYTIPQWLLLGFCFDALCNTHRDAACCFALQMLQS